MTADRPLTYQQAMDLGLPDQRRPVRGADRPGPDGPLDRDFAGPRRVRRSKHPDPDEYPPLTVAEHLEMLALGEAIAFYYRHPAGVDHAVRAGATWEQIAAARNTTAEAARAAYREWAEGQHSTRSDTAASRPGRLTEYAAGASGPQAKADGRRMTARPDPFRIHVADQVARRAGRGGHADVHPADPGRHRLRPAVRPAGLHGADPAGQAGEVEKIAAPGKPVYWRRLAPLISLPPMTVCTDRDRRRPS